MVVVGGHGYRRFLEDAAATAARYELEYGVGVTMGDSDDAL